MPTKLHTDVVHTFASHSRAESINRRSTSARIVGWNPEWPQPLLWTQQGASLSDWDGWELLTNWGSCAGESMGPPQSVSDCIARVGLDPVALSACISVIE